MTELLTQNITERVNFHPKRITSNLTVTYASSTQSPGNNQSEGAFVWDQSGIRITGIMRVCVCLGAILIPESLDFQELE